MKGVPEARPTSYPRAKFVLEQIFAIAWRILFCDCRRLFFLKFIYTRYTSLLAAPLLPDRLLLGASIIMETRFMIEIPYFVLSTMAVTVGWGTPADWPPLFDTFLNAWSVRKFWSHCWHQMMRLQAEPIVKGLLHGCLKVEHGTTFSNYGHVLGNFFIAFVTHALPRWAGQGRWQEDRLFFMLQCFAIIAEDLVVWVFRKLGLGPYTILGKLCGYAWTFSFISLCWIQWYEMAQQGGDAFKNPAFGISIIEPALAAWQGR